ncbi:MAG TPA: SUF system NifU family Fe-S cluster assembly protein [Coxiellaceae bacterium]|nr:SUF system NifU family Fe-S cluster assembly protein [Coxiellaceae bacterium]
MSDLNELYQSLIIDHSRHPKNFGMMEQATAEQRGYNPVCGDELTVYLKEKNDIVEAIQFQGHGCAISIASASLMTETVKGKTKTETLHLFKTMHDLLTGQPVNEALVGKCLALQGVSHYPMRVKCASLAWHTLKAALQHQPETVSTE